MSDKVIKVIVSQVPTKYYLQMAHDIFSEFLLANKINKQIVVLK